MENDLLPDRKAGRFYGVGVGPGDPELITLKAHRLISNASTIAYISTRNSPSQARTIAANSINASASTPRDINIAMPMSTNRSLANAAYDKGAASIREALLQGEDVVFLCEGDPLFFGSFAYLLERLQDEFSCEVVPGISSINAAAAVLLEPLTMLCESFVVISGRHSEDHIRDSLQKHDTVVIMKAGLARPRILALLKETGRLQDARYLEYISREQQQVLPDVSQLANEAGPYFSLFVIMRERTPANPGTGSKP